MKLKLLNDLVLVAMEPIRPNRGIIQLVHGERVRKGKVLAFGPGRYYSAQVNMRVPVGVEVGDKVVFFRENLEHKQGKAIMHLLTELGDNIGLIKGADILFIDDEDVDVTA